MTYLNQMKYVLYTSMKLFFVFYKSFPKHQSVHQHLNISKTTVIKMYYDTSKRFHFMIINAIISFMYFLYLINII